MITALYAMRVDGAFGVFNPATMDAYGELPWGSIPEELEQFYKILDTYQVVILGHNTYTTAPPRLKKALERKSMVYVVGSASPILIKNPPRNVRFITHLGSKIRDFCNEVEVVCIGGKALLETLATMGCLDAIYRSTIYPKAGTVPSLDHIMYLEHPILTSTPPDAVVTHVASGENERYRFVMEGVYL